MNHACLKTSASYLCLLFFGLAFVFVSSVMGGETGVVNQDAPVYVPPKRGAPIKRMGGATRKLFATGLQKNSARMAWFGSGEQSGPPDLMVLAPAHVGLTHKEAPSLFWNLSRTLKHPLNIRLAQKGKAWAILETRLKPPVAPGMHRLKLTDYDLTIEPDIAYVWTLSTVDDSGNGPSRIEVNGSICRVPPSSMINEKLALNSVSSVALLAQEGLWYDAIENLLENMEPDSFGMGQRPRLNGLLKQVSLPPPNVR